MFSSSSTTPMRQSRRIREQRKQSKHSEVLQEPSTEFVISLFRHNKFGELLKLQTGSPKYSTKRFQELYTHEGFSVVWAALAGIHTLRDAERCYKMLTRLQWWNRKYLRNIHLEIDVDTVLPPLNTLSFLELCEHQEVNKKEHDIEQLLEEKSEELKMVFSPDLVDIAITPIEEWLQEKMRSA